MVAENIFTLASLAAIAELMEVIISSVAIFIEVMTPTKALAAPPNIPVTAPMNPLNAGAKAMTISPVPCSNMKTIASNSTKPGGIILKNPENTPLSQSIILPACSAP